VADYLRILRTPHVAALFLATTMVRLPFGINSLAILLFLRETTGSFGVAGLGAGATAVGAGLGALLVARLVDRRGTGLLLPLALVHSTALLALVALGDAGVGAGALVPLAGLVGVTFPPTGSVFRARFPRLLSADPMLVSRAYALDSIVIELSFIGGPLITALIVAFAGPGLALVVSALLLAGGTAWFVAVLPREPRPTATSGNDPLGALTSPAVRLIAATTVPVGFCIGAVEVALPAFSHAEGAEELGGVLLALWSLASALGGLVYGARAAGRDPAGLFMRIAWLFPVASLPLAAASSPLTVAAAAMLAGLPMAPLIASRNELLSLVAPVRTVTEAFSWLMTALLAGSAAGAAVGGALVEAGGWELAVLAGAGVATLGALLSAAGRNALVPAPSPGRA
jgi:MFS family permease